MHFCGLFGPLSKGNFRHTMTTIVGNRGQLWTSTSSPHLLSPHLDFPNRGYFRMGVHNFGRFLMGLVRMGSEGFSLFFFSFFSLFFAFRFSSFSSLFFVFFAFLRFSSFFFVFLRFSPFSLRTSANDCKKFGNFTPTPSAPTPLRTSRDNS